MKANILITSAVCALACMPVFASNTMAASTETHTITETRTVTASDGSTVTTTTVTTTETGSNDRWKTDLTPKVHGVMRTRWEGEFGEEEFGQRFQVRNARVNIGGNVLPPLSYFIQVDFCDRGKILFLDAWAQWNFSNRWKIRAGQFRVPYGTDCFRGPGAYYFANRSFVARNILNMREVGVRGGYYGSSKVPLTVEAGIFNSADRTNHEVWQRQMNYAVKASYRIGNVTVSPSFISYQPQRVRINLAGGSVTWQSGRWIAEGEYARKHYTNNAHRPTDAWNVFTSYTLPLRDMMLDQLSFQGRFDGMTAHSNGIADSDGYLHSDNAARRRITAGISLGHSAGPVKGLIRLNYEKFFYDKGVTAHQGEGDKILTELVVKF